MKHRMIPTAEYGEALALGRFKTGHDCFNLRGSPEQLHKRARAEGLNHIYYRVVAEPEPRIAPLPHASCLN